MPKTITQGNWNTACDSYGKVQHSRKYNCVYSSLVNERGHYLYNVAARIENYEDAKTIAAVPLMLDYIRKQAETGDQAASIILNAISSNAASAYDDARKDLGTL